MTIQNLVELYTLETLAARLNRSEVGVRTRLRASGRIPKGRRNGQPGGYLVWDVDVIEAAIAADPGLVLPAKAKGDGQ